MSRYILFFIFTFLFGSIALANTTHIVKPGEYILQLSRQYNITLSELLKANPNVKYDKPLTPGTKLNIPETKKKEPIQLASTKHTVAINETIFSIAKRYGVSVDEIVNDNKIKNNKIFVGMSLIIKNPKLSPPEGNKESTTQVSMDKEHDTMINIEKTQVEPITNNFLWPVKGKVIAKFKSDYYGYPMEGVEIGHLEEGDLVRASASGTIIYTGEFKEFGNIVIIKHYYNFITIYGHLSEALAPQGNRIKRGQVIGYVGKSGNINQPQLYFSIRRNGISYDPENLIKNKN